MKEIITEAAFRSRLASSPRGGFLFFGDEDYLKHHALKNARATVCPDPSLAVFNDMSVDCSVSGFSPDAIASAIAAAPMMTDTKIVTVSGLDIKRLQPEEISALCDALSSLEEYDFNTFILYVPAGMIEEGRLPKAPAAALAKLGEKLTPVHFARVSGAKLASWVIRHFEHRGVRAEAGVTDTIFARCGNDMFALANEIDKLSFFVLANGRSVVTKEDVETVTCAVEEFSTFDFGNAIMNGNASEALRILGVMKSRKTPTVMILGELSSTFSDMLTIKLLASAGKPTQEIAALMRWKSDFRVQIYLDAVRNIPQEKLKYAVSLCADADKAVKQSFAEGYEELEKLVCLAV